MKKRAFWMLGLAVLLAVASVVVAQKWLQNQTKPIDTAMQPLTAQVVVARVPLDFGSVIRKDHVRVIAWPKDSVPEGAFLTVAEMVGEDENRVALRPMEVNEPVLKSKVSGFGGRASLSAVIAEEMRATTIRVNDVNGVAGFVMPGDRVDVLLTRDPTQGKRRSRRNNTRLITHILLHNVKVLGIDQDSNDKKDKPAVVKAVTLEVTPYQGQKLVLGQQVGTLSLALRNVNDDAAQFSPTVRLADLMRSEVAVPPKPKVRVKRTTGKRRKVVRKSTWRPVSRNSKVKIIRALKSSTYKVDKEKSGKDDKTGKAGKADKDKSAKGDKKKEKSAGNVVTPSVVTPSVSMKQPSYGLPKPSPVKRGVEPSGNDREARNDFGRQRAANSGPVSLFKRVSPGAGRDD